MTPNEYTRYLLDLAWRDIESDRAIEARRRAQELLDNYVTRRATHQENTKPCPTKPQKTSTNSQ